MDNLGGMPTDFFIDKDNSGKNDDYSSENQGGTKVYLKPTKHNITTGSQGPIKMQSNVTRDTIDTSQYSEMTVTYPVDYNGKPLVQDHDAFELRN